MDDFLNPDFRAQLTFFTEAEGGIRIPVGNAYRPKIQFDQLDEISFISIEFLATDVAFAGDVLDAELAIVVKDEFLGKVFKGLDFSILEGDRIIGTGVVLEVLNDELQY
jgi:translation elongation factor EF-Tu-like GTPase